MGFAGVYRAIYSYNAASDQELSLVENDMLYLLETADDGWWSVKKRVEGAASEEPEGIVPHNYIEPAKSVGKANALYSYEKQNSEELSFAEGVSFDVYATDGDWVLVGNGEFGFVPSNYIEQNATQPPTHQQQASQGPQSPYSAPDAAASVSTPSQTSHVPSQDVPPAQPARPQHHSGQTHSGQHSPVVERVGFAPPKPARPSRPPSIDEDMDDIRPDPRDRELPPEPTGRKAMSWPILDVVGRRKIPKTLVVAPKYITLIADDGGGHTQKWDVHDIKSYNSEKKYVFLDLANPRASLQLKTGSQSEADNIIASMGTIVGAGRSGGGLEEVLAAAENAGLKQGQVLLDFKAANSQELSVTENEPVSIVSGLDKEWTLVRNNRGQEGLVPRKFLHLELEEPKLTGLFKGKKQREKQREKDRAGARETAAKLERTRSTREESSPRRSCTVHRSGSTHNRSRSKLERSGSKRALPDSRKMRLWVDRTGSFKVDAQLLGCSDGKVHLHKANGVKIAVPAAKLSIVDLEYVESVTGVNLGDDKPLDKYHKVSWQPSSAAHASNGNQNGSNSLKNDANNAANNVAGERYDYWLSFFLECGVDPQNANRYAKNFARDNMDESSLAGISASVLRTLGLREGDILRVTRRINEKLSRVTNPEGGLYSTEGALQNNSGATPKSVENEVWQKQATPQSAQGTPQPATQPAPHPALESQPIPPQPTQPIQPQTTQPIQPQITQPVQSQITQPVQPQITQPVQQTQPTGALADLLGMMTISQTLQMTQPTGSSLLESQITAQQRQTQHQILRQQAELQKEQIRLLKEQQEQLRRQQDELVQIQKTGSQLQALGPFATGVAQMSTFAPTSAASVLGTQPPPPPAARQFAPAQSLQSVPSQMTGPFQQPQPTTFQTQPFLSQTTGPFQSQTTGGFTGHTTGGFQAQSFPSQATGPFQSGLPTGGMPTGEFQPTTSFQIQTTGTQQQSQHTGPFPSQTTGPFLPQTSFQRGPPQTGFQASTLFQSQPQTTGGFTAQTFPSQSFQSQSTGPFQAQTFQSQQRTGPFQSQATGPFQSQPTTFQPQQSFPLSTFPSQTTGLFQQQQESFPSQNTGPFQPQQQPNGFGMSSFQPLQPTPAQRTASFGTPQPTSFSSQSTATFQTAASFPMLQQQTQPQTQPQTQQSTTSLGNFGQQQPLQTQATGFGFGNQPSQPPRANLSMATASNPFGL